jgi:peptidoglycan/xylan/chitin deacetylase (PgdA/CDA1 family)
VRLSHKQAIDLSQLGLGVHALTGVEDKRTTINKLLMVLKYLPADQREAHAQAVSASTQATLPPNLMMTPAHVRTLHNANMQIGGHTASHPILANLDPESARAEIAEGKEQLEAIIAAPVRLFAYPNGKPNRDYLEDHVKMVKDLGFTAGVSTAPGVATSASDVYQLPRFTPWDVNAGKFILRLALNLFRTRFETV